jgi:hypothetical protein
MSLERLTASANTSDHQPIPSTATRKGAWFMTYTPTVTADILIHA